MADMNVKGGYFAPSNYLKVNEGGSHDENPNGGVQIGVDQNGTPNMLEEGEPVYNDFVYSDNIIADAEFLAKHNLPKKYEGWLYSRIADDLFEEYSATPLDPISKNGADVMLTRLAECQEEQKQVAEQRELEQMIAELSPEEQEALMQMVAQEAQQPSPEEMAMTQQQVMPQEQMPVEQAPMQIPPEQMALPGQMPVIADCGGKINRYDDGGEKEGWLQNIWHTATRQPVMGGVPTSYATSGQYMPYVDSTVGEDISYALDVLPFPVPVGSLVNESVEGNKAGFLGTAALALSPFILRNAKSVGRSLKWLEKAKEMELKAGKKLENTANALSDLAKAKTDAENSLLTSANQIRKLTGELAEATNKKDVAKINKQLLKVGEEYNKAAKTVRKAPWEIAGKKIERNWLTGAERDAKSYRNLVEKVTGLGDEAANATSLTQPPVSPKTPKSELTKKQKWTRAGVGLGIGAGVTGLSLLGNNIIKNHRPIDYGEPIVADDSSATPMDTQIYTGVQNNPVYDWSSIFDDNYEANGGEINRYDNPLIPGLLQRPKYNAGLRPNMEGFFDTYTNGINNGRYHSLRDSSGRTVSGVGYGEAEQVAEQPRAAAPVTANASVPVSPSSVASTHAPIRAVGAELDPFVNRKNIPYIDMSGATAGLTPKYSPLVDNRLLQGMESQAPSDKGAGEPEGVEGTSYSYNALSTWPRYAGAVGSGLRLLNNVIQPADEYNSAYYHPEQIYNYLPLIDPRFNPIDINRTDNSVINQSNATARALMNSGVGGSTPAALIAADAVANANRGAARAQDMQINEQLYNQALAGTNSNAAARSQNDLAVDRYNAQARMDAQYRNIPLALQLQMLNNQAEAQKYAAIGQEAQNLEYALQGIGRENFAMNQINSNPAFEGYGVSPYGILNYLANISEDGGFIKKIKKAKK